MGARAIATLGCLAALAATPAAAQTFPGKTIHLVVPYAAGGTGDIVARVVSEKLSVALGQSVVVENRPGASGGFVVLRIIAASGAARQGPDVALVSHLTRKPGSRHRQRCDRDHSQGDLEQR